MRFVRENLFYVILVAVVLVGAVAAVLYYTGSGIDKNVKAREDVSRDIRRLVKDPTKVFEDAVAKKQKLVEKLKEQNEADQKRCEDFNRLAVLKIPYGAAGALTEDATPFDPKRYRDKALYIPYMKKINDTLEQYLAAPSLAATAPPTQEQIFAERDKLIDTFSKQNPAEVLDRATRRMILQQAEAGMIYVDEKALDRVFPKDSRAIPRPEKMWEAQVNVWVTNEILQAITATNQDWLAGQRKLSGAETPGTVVNSAVKHLLKLAISESVMPSVAGAERAQLSLTSRKTSSQYAVVQYGFRVIMPTKHIRLLMEKLESRNYHTVTKVAVKATDRAGMTGFYYGTEPVADVLIEGELLLLGSWVRDVVPESMVNLFGGRSPEKAEGV